MKHIKLGAICNIEIGRTPSRNQPKYWGNGYSWLSIADMKNLKFLSDTKEQVTDLAIRECNMKLVPQGTLLFSFKLSVGKVGIASKDLFTNEAIAALKIKSEKEVYQPFLYHALGSLNFDGKGDRAVKGITLNKAKLRELLIPLPPLPEQKRITEILDKADALRQKNKQLLAAYDELLQATFLDMFGDPVTNPKGWKKMNGEDYCEKIGVGVVIKPASYYVDSGVIALRSLNIKPDEIDLNNLVYFSEKSCKKELSKSILKVGDVVFVRTGVTGTAAVIPEKLDGCNCIDLIIARPNINIIHPKYLASFFNSEGGKKLVSSKEVGGIQKHFNIGAIKKLPIPVPNIKLQNQYAKIIENIEAQKTLVKQSLQESEDLFNGLVQKAFGGEL